MMCSYISFTFKTDLNSSVFCAFSLSVIYEVMKMLVCNMYGRSGQ